MTASKFLPRLRANACSGATPAAKVSSIHWGKTLPVQAGHCRAKGTNPLGGGQFGAASENALEPERLITAHAVGMRHESPVDLSDVVRLGDRRRLAG